MENHVLRPVWAIAGSVLLLGGLLWARAATAKEPACSGTAAAAADAVALTYDLPQYDSMGAKRLRTTADPLQALEDGLPADAGLVALRASGSSQFSDAGWAGIVQILARRAGVDASTPLVVVDLRQEPHALMDGQPVSWRTEANDLNAHRARAALLADEADRIAALQGQATPPLQRVCKVKDAQGRKHALYTPEPLPAPPRTLQSEADWALAQGLQFWRLPMTDHTGAPSDASVDAFLQLVAGRRSDDWLHFHCRGGQGRTSLFMAMLDMVAHARHLSVAQVVARQRALGGVDLWQINAHEPQKGTDRRAFLTVFHRFLTTRPAGSSWSAWRQEGAADHSEL